MGLTASFSISAFLYWRGSLRIPFGRKEYIPCQRERQSLTPGLNAGPALTRGHRGRRNSFLPMPQSLWPLGLFLFVGTGARVIAGTAKIRQALLARSGIRPLLGIVTNARSSKLGAWTKRLDAARQGAIGHRQTEMILLFRREIQRETAREKDSLYRLLSSKAQLATHFSASISISAFL